MLLKIQFVAICLNMVLVMGYHVALLEHILLSVDVKSDAN